ncbi:MAG: aminotransferase class I/II-fold pyridoxal phosphate-dependent enzyme [Gammaproteobacteria bacterium]|nr:aminotransferase class I/II-fold pyridoxal phosphate-dependent enzyme [Gammaproteobacteria bacterium]
MWQSSVLQWSIVTAGSNMAFLQLMAVVADPGAQVILPLPYFFNQRMALEILGIEPVLVATDHAFQLDPERIAAAVTAKTRAIVTVSPNNPTGAVYPEAALKQINELCAARGLIHVSDEAYQHFVFEGATHFSPASVSGAEAHTITLFSLSKSYGIAGWRVGCALVPRRLMHDVRKVQDTNLICAPVPSQRLAAVLLAEGSEWRKAKVAQIAALRQPLIRALAAMSALLEAPVTEGAFYFMLRLPRTGPDMPLVERLIREHGIALIPGSAFGAGPQMHLRLAYGALTRASLDDAMARLRQGLSAARWV